MYDSAVATLYTFLSFSEGVSLSDYIKCADMNTWSALAFYISTTAQNQMDSCKKVKNIFYNLNLRYACPKCYTDV